MARITARQAFTRAKSKRERGKTESNKALVEARRRYVRQLAEVGIEVDGASQPPRTQDPVARGRGRRSMTTAQAQHVTKKITDYFTKTRSLDLFHPKVKQPLRTSSSFDPNGVECVTIYESDTECCDNNNNNNNNNNNDDTANNQDSGISNANTSRNSSGGSSIWESSSESGNSSQMTQEQMLNSDDIKPTIARVDISNLGVSFEELQLKVKVDEDIEIVDMLPPIPLRKHEIFDLDEEENEQVTPN